MLIAKALVHSPEMLILDEPTAGLDVTSARKVRGLVRSLGDEGGTVIYSTHMLSEAQRICDRILIIHNGTVRADGSPDDLLKSTGTADLEDAYMALTQDVSRMNRQEEESGLSRWWLKLSMRGKKSNLGEEE